MEIRLIQRDHPDPVVNDFGLSHRDPYFRACWGALLDARTTNLLTQVADLTRGCDRMIDFDELCQKLDPTPADRRSRLAVMTWAMNDAERAGLGRRHHVNRSLTWFCVYRNVPLLDEPSLRRLTDPELFAHTDAIRDINLRLAMAGIQQVVPPDWLAERLGRADPAIRVADPQPPKATAALGRLEALRHPQVPSQPGLSV